MNLELLKSLRDDHAAVAQHLNAAVDILEGRPTVHLHVQMSVPALDPAAAAPEKFRLELAEAGTVRDSKPEVKRKDAETQGRREGPKGKHGGSGGSNRSPQRAAMLAWAATQPDGFTFDDLPKHCRRETELQTRQMLSNAASAGLLMRMGGGHFKLKGARGKGRQDSRISRKSKTSTPPGPEWKPVPPPQPTRVKTGSIAFVPKRGVSRHQEAITQIAVQLGAKAKWTAGEMEKWVTAQFPALMERESQRTDCRVRLIDMANADLLVREGQSPFTTYRLGPNLLLRDVGASAEAPLRVSVPRDADAGEDS